MNGKAKTRLAFQTFGFALMAISLVFMFVVVAFPYAIGLDVIVSSYNFYTQNAVVDHPLIGIVNTQLPNNAPSIAWYSTTYAGRIDQQYASATISKTASIVSTYPYVFDDGQIMSGSSGSSVENTAYLTTQLYNFSLPTEAIPTGLIVQAVSHSRLGTFGALASATCSITDNSVRLIAYGKYVGIDHATTITWPKEADSVFQWGGSNDQWGVTLTQDMVMAPDFGVAISGKISTAWTIPTNIFPGYKIGTSCTSYIDMISMTLLYKLPVYTTITSSGTTVTTATTPQTVTITNQGTTSTVTTSQTATPTLTTASTSTFVTTPVTVTMTYSPTTYTWTQPGTTTVTSTQTGGTSIQTLSTTSVSGGGFLGGGIVGSWTNQFSALTAGLITFLSGFGISLFGWRRP